MEPVLSFGDMPLANSFLSQEHLTDPEPTYPLEVVFCSSCSLVQLTVSVSPERIFREYLYFSSFSDAMLRHSQNVVERLIKERELDERSLVVEVASNDGYLLQYFVEAGVPVIGIEPAYNVARVAEQRGIPTVTEFFDRELADRLLSESDGADVIIANNVLAHVPDLNQFVEGIRILLKNDGVAVFETPYIKDLVDGCEFDTIYHEHHCYYSLTALDRLFRQHELRVVDVEPLKIHGGSLRLYVTRPEAAGKGQSVGLMLKQEEQLGVQTLEYYRNFAAKVEQLTTALSDSLGELKANGCHVAGYGAAAKGSILLNVCGLDSETVDFVVDRSDYKQGRCMPGCRIPISPPARLLEAMPEYALILIWNLAEEIQEQQAEYHRRGGKFIVPIPGISII